jgi:hypothetical protein
MAAALVLAETIDGMTEAPATDSPSTPRQACRVPELCRPSELLCYGSAGDTFRVLLILAHRYGEGIRLT